ncbi:hypothetical protein ASPBRDRAFT_45767 [Aspergillus brasiliensis CBS 101740]|uniref:Uncharacterized protein n=1 Tax=Aspergillus brasiliensis (strain CBS 101740 / IMI 381727 / IBT 21946) TaxID=767769 RepID=A0A1L9UCN7_ASPBC|nr:hypothetical protein ASPBRDRAFT_45767 [Aspergillus brasiliensis CBS 101740]
MSITPPALEESLAVALFIFLPRSFITILFVFVPYGRPWSSFHSFLNVAYAPIFQNILPFFCLTFQSCLSFTLSKERVLVDSS